MHYSSWAQNFPGLIFVSVFCDHEYISKDDTLLQLMVSAHCVNHCKYVKSLKTKQIAPEGLSLLHCCVLTSKKCLAPNKGI